MYVTQRLFDVQLDPVSSSNEHQQTEDFIEGANAFFDMLSEIPNLTDKAVSVGKVGLSIFGLTVATASIFSQIFPRSR